MKPKLHFFLLLLALFLFVSCQKTDKPLTKEDYAIDMMREFPQPTALPSGGGKCVKVILLLGQSNASGSSIVSYLKEQIDPEHFAVYEKGFDTVKINYCIDNGYCSSDGDFLPVDLTAGCGNGFFGPEVGMAEVFADAFPDEEIVILKYTMSGYSLNYHWLYDGKRAWIYDACLDYVKTYMTALRDADYDATIEAIAWMQGESDTTEEKAARYFDNQVKFVSYLRNDLAAYAPNGFYFIDAGISSSPYCEPGYPTVNEAKRRFAALSEKNRYFSTIDMGLSTLYEPTYEPDLGHYDALSEIALGRRFGEEIVRCLEN